jgi:hypothetical protein
MGVIIALASFGSFGGGTLGDLFAQWEAAGIFAYALPFLLIFALVYGLLMKLNIFSSAKDPNSGRGVNVIIALAVSFMALQFNMVSMFFGEIFPRMGVALSIILVILILGGLFMPTNKKNNWFMVTLTIIVFVIIGVVVYNSLSMFGWSIGGWGLSSFWNKYGSLVIFAAIIIAVIAMTSPSKKVPDFAFSNHLSRSIGETD